MYVRTSHLQLYIITSDRAYGTAAILKFHSFITYQELCSSPVRVVLKFTTPSSILLIRFDEFSGLPTLLPIIKFKK